MMAEHYTCFPHSHPLGIFADLPRTDSNDLAILMMMMMVKEEEEGEMHASATQPETWEDQTAVLNQ